MGVAPDDLRGDRGLDVGQVEDALFRGELGMEDDLEPQVAELIREGWGRAALEGVVDLVGLLEQMVPERLVGLLAIPRAAVGSAEALRDRWQPPRRGERLGRRDRPEDDGPGEIGLAQLVDRRRRRDAQPADRVVGRVQAAQDGEAVSTARAVTAR